MPFASPSDPPAEIAADAPAEPAGAAGSIADSAISPPHSGRSKLSLRDLRLRPILSCAGAVGVGLTLAPLILRPAATPVTGGKEPLAEVVLARESTLIVTPTLPPGLLLRGRLRLVAGATDAVGRAPVGGQVARQLVENGAHVERGDAIIEISSGAGQRAAPASESRQNSAEQSQIAAADAQTALSQKIATAQTRLRVAQERVARAQAQTGVARDIVRRLQNGQSVSPGEIPAPYVSAAPQPRSRRARRSERGTARDTSRAESRPNRATQIAARQAEAARGAAQESVQALQTARAMLFEAQNVARQADEKAESSAQAVVDVEAQFDAKKASGADVEAARIAQKDAQSAVNTADKALIFAKTELGKREKNAATAQSYAQTSATQAAKLLASARLEPAPGAGANSGVAPQSVPDATGNSASNGGASGEAQTPDAATPEAPARVTLDNAIRFASEALDESRRASREAERINSEIAGYQSQVTRSNSRIEAATQGLEKAQQGVMNSVPRVRFTSTLAPSSGIVTWISRLAREVGAGDAVFGIAGSQRVAAHFEDKSGLWRAIKPGAVLTAFVVDAPTPVVAPANAPGASPKGPVPTAPGSPNALLSTTVSPAPAAPVDDVTQLGAGHAVSLKMTEIGAPESPEKPATLTGALVAGAENGASGAESLAEGAQILVSVPRPHAKATLSVPASALLQRSGATYIAVLAPLTRAENQEQNRQQHPSEASESASPQNPNRAGETSATATPTGPTETGTSKTDTGEMGAAKMGENANLAATGQAATGASNANEAFHLRWVRVETGRSDGLRLEIVAGLRAGERVVSAPDDLEAMGLSPAPDAAPTVFDIQNATPAPTEASQAAPTAKPGESRSDAAGAEILVRLTGTTA